jgi:hypothetical protein
MIDHGRFFVAQKKTLKRLLDKNVNSIKRSKNELYDMGMIIIMNIIYVFTRKIPRDPTFSNGGGGPIFKFKYIFIRMSENHDKIGYNKEIEVLKSVLVSTIC